MAVPTTTISDRYDCDNSNQAFPITFVYLDSGNVAVQLYDASLGTYETLVEDTDYTVANDTVTTADTYAAKYDIIIQLDPDLTQLTDWVNNDKFTSDSWENAIDKLTLITKMLQDQIDRCVRGPDGDASLDWKLDEGAVDRAGNYLHFNSLTGAIEVVGILTASVTATAFAQTLLDDTSISAFLTTLEFSPYFQTLVDQTSLSTLVTTMGLNWGVPELKSAFVLSNADYTVLDDDDYTDIKVTAGASARTVTLGTAADNDNRSLRIIKADSGVGKVIIDGEGAEVIINGGQSFTSVELWYQQDSITLQCDGTRWLKTNPPSWRKIENPTTGILEAITSWTSTDSFSSGASEDYSSLCALGSLAVRAPLTIKTATGNIYQRRSGDSNITNTPHASEEFHARISNDGFVVAELWLNNAGVVQLAAVTANTDLDVYYPESYLW